MSISAPSAKRAKTQIQNQTSVSPEISLFNERLNNLSHDQLKEIVKSIIPCNPTLLNQFNVIYQINQDELAEKRRKAPPKNFDYLKIHTQRYEISGQVSNTILDSVKIIKKGLKESNNYNNYETKLSALETLKK
ncbi:uncharacterized protein L201_004063 [Kwoniella dendrophila CBS 6074]|uniref:Uncharacterized protein n=1 Tax=Kwoniella dendrophila CBS 6074 TaxID=1295534 RepID=A0AAX4JX88_9TREE